MSIRASLVSILIELIGSAKLESFAQLIHGLFKNYNKKNDDCLI